MTHRKALPLKSLSRALAVLFLLLPAAAWAGPPYQTDDPEPPDPGHWELILAALATVTPGGAGGAAPQLEFNYGAAPDLQLSVSPQMAYDTPRGGTPAYGLGDVELGAKYRFLHETRLLPEAALYPQVTLPTGSAVDGLGNGAAQVFLPLWAQKSWGPWTSFGGGGYWINPGQGNRNWTFVGAALTRDLGERFTVGGELFYQTAAQSVEVGPLGDSLVYASEAQTQGSPGSNLGLEVHFTPSDHLILSAGRDLGPGRSVFTGYLGYMKLI